MRTIALILSGAVILGVAGFALLVATLPRAKVTIRAVGPAGGFSERVNESGEEVREPSWRFAITNVGQAGASWTAYLRVKDDGPAGQSVASQLGNYTNGTLMANQGSVTTLAVPKAGNVLWSGAVMYSSKTTSREWKLRDLAAHVPALRHLLPGGKTSIHFDAWHSTTNAAPPPPQSGTNL